MTTNANAGDLPFTGERYVPRVQGKIALEHWHRYFLAREFAGGKTVLDIACGEGYGSALLSAVAQSAIGVDISAKVIAHAARRYQRSNLEFRVGSCASMPVSDSSVDLVVSFETIEHHNEHVEMFREIKRVLRPGGMLIMSSPERVEFGKYRAESAKRIKGLKDHMDNDFHVKELDRAEFETLVREHFAHIAIFGQRLLFGSAIFLEGSAGHLVVHEVSEHTSDPQRSDGIGHPVYLVTIASDEALPALSSSFCSKRIGPDQVELIWPSGIIEMLKESQHSSGEC